MSETTACLQYQFVSVCHTANYAAAVAQGIVAQMRIAGATIGVAVSFIVLHERVMSELERILSPGQLRDFYQSPLSTSSLTLPQLIIARHAYVAAFRDIMRLSIGVSGACLLVSLLVWQKRPFQIQEKLQAMENYLGAR